MRFRSSARSSLVMPSVTSRQGLQLGLTDLDYAPADSRGEDPVRDGLGCCILDGKLCAGVEQECQVDTA